MMRGMTKHTVTFEVWFKELRQLANMIGEPLVAGDMAKLRYELKYYDRGATPAETLAAEIDAQTGGGL